MLSHLEGVCGGGGGEKERERKKDVGEDRVGGEETFIYHWLH